MPPRFRTSLLCVCLLALACIAPAGALAAKTGGTSGTSGSSTSSSSGSASAATGGVGPDDPRYKPPKRAKIINGLAYAPKSAPPQVVNAIAAANQIVRMPYRWGGGHKSFQDSAYDCSGSVSFALHGGGLLTAPLDSSSFMNWGMAGKGRWITVYANGGHAFAMIAGLRFDTGYRDRRSAKGAAPGSGPRWGYSRPTSGFSARHPNGL
jgi:hypothetical protein